MNYLLIILMWRSLSASSGAQPNLSKQQPFLAVNKSMLVIMILELQKLYYLIGLNFHPDSSQ